MLRPRAAHRVLATLALGLAACPAPSPARESVIEGDAPALQAWVGSMGCCGEDPHPVHGAALGDGSVVLVGKAAAGGGETAGFVTRWWPPPGPATGAFIDEAENVIANTLVLDGDSALLQVVETGGLIVAVGFTASSASGAALGLALALDPDSFEVLARLELDAPTSGRSAALESVVSDGAGRLVLGGGWNFGRAQMEGFKSYGNLLGGRGLVVDLELDAWLAASGGARVGLAELGATVRELPEVHSVKSMAVWADGSVVGVAADPEELSGMLWIEADLGAHRWQPFDDGFELTDLAVFSREGEADAIALVGHGGAGTIDGHAKLVDPEGAVLWTTTFGNPGLAPSDTPSEGLAPDAFIFDECWGVAQRGPELVLACGTGIEGCSAVSASAADKALCRSDPRRTWRSFLVGLDGAGALAWSRAEAFVEASGEASESAAEYVFVDAAGTIYAVVDHDFGVGLARLGP